MKLVSVKKPADVLLKGIKVRFMEEDNGLVGVEFTDTDGRRAVIKVASSYGSNVKVMVPAPPKKEPVFRVVGDLSNQVKVCEQYADKSEAQGRLRDLKSNDYAAELRLEEDEVLVDEAETTTAASADGSIPF